MCHRIWPHKGELPTRLRCRDGKPLCKVYVTVVGLGGVGRNDSGSWKIENALSSESESTVTAMVCTAHLG